MKAIRLALAWMAVATTSAALAQPASRPVSTQSIGAHAAMLDFDPNLSNHTIYRPKAIKSELPVVIFAGGGCRNAGGRFRALLTEIASHGYFVIALGPPGDPENDSNLDNEPDYRGRPTKTDVSQITYAAKWSHDENTRRGSKWRGKLDASRLTLMGQSCGGVQAIDVATLHLPKATTLVALNTGLFENDREMGGSKVKRADLGKLTMPTLIMLGGKDEIAYANGMANYDLATAAPIMVASAPYGHRGTYFQPRGGLFGGVIVDWLAWRVRGDANAARTFLGDDCRLCNQPEWEVKRRLSLLAFK